jgi:hypothetical protein
MCVEGGRKWILKQGIVFGSGIRKWQLKLAVDSGGVGRGGRKW